MKGKRTRREEKFVNRYYDDLRKAAWLENPDLSDQKAFEKQEVYDRVLGTIRYKERLRLMIRKNYRVAAALAMLLCVSFLFYLYKSGGMVEKTTPKGEVMHLTLDDGTSVWLNAESSLTYPKRFKDDTREVSLTGEAYFEVARNTGKPFMVHTDSLTTRVLGTRFNIKAYAENKNITVSVVAGKVSVARNGKETDITGESIQVTPDQEAVYSRADQSLKLHKGLSSADAAAWKEGRLVYRSTPLHEIIADMQRKYGVSIQADNNIRDCSISVDLNDVPLNKALKILTELINGKVEQEDTGYRLKGKGC